jgi:hypothetical protein
VARRAWNNRSPNPIPIIPKPGHTSYELARSFRPISLTSFVLKTMEKLVDQSIRVGLLKRFPLEHSQHAYQRGRSSETALHNLVSRIKSAVGHKIFALGVFLNVEGHVPSFEAMS